MGTNVQGGRAQVLVVQTGANTAFGQIAARPALRPPETEFERGIRRLGYLLMDVEGAASDAVFRLAYLNARFQSGLANHAPLSTYSKYTKRRTTKVNEPFPRTIHMSG